MGSPRENYIEYQEKLRKNPDLYDKPLPFRVKLTYICEYETTIEAEDKEHAVHLAQEELDHESFDYEEFSEAQVKQVTQ